MGCKHPQTQIVQKNILLILKILFIQPKLKRKFEKENVFCPNVISFMRLNLIKHGQHSRHQTQQARHGRFLTSGLLRDKFGDKTHDLRLKMS